MYISQDPIGIEGNNPNLYAYTHDSNTMVDPWGLSECPFAEALKRLQSQAADNAHFFDRHGAHLTDAELRLRALSGKLPDTGVIKKPVNATKFATHETQLEAIQKALDIQKRFGTGTGFEEIIFDMDKVAGVGYEKLRLGTKLSTNQVTTYFMDGKLVTAFPSFPKTIPIGIP